MHKCLRILLSLLMLASYIPLWSAPAAQAASLPTGWNSMGFNGSSGASDYDNSAGTLTVTSSGNGITNQTSTSEQFQYAYTAVTGDFTLISRLTSNPYVSGSQAGILLRSTLAQGSSFVFGYLYGTGNKYQPYVSLKATAGAAAAGNSGYKVSSVDVTYDYASLPKYMRLRKQWNTTSNKTDVYYDLGTSDGTNITWTQITGKSITDAAANQTMYVGFAVGKTASASFDSITLLNQYKSESATAVASLTTSLATSLAAPTLTAASGDNKVTLNWPSVTDATYYNLYRRITSADPYSKINGGGITGTGTISYTDNSVTNNQPYKYAVTAANSVSESVYSNEVTATPAALSAPAAPANLAASPGDAQMSLSWNSVSGAASYNIKRSETKGGPYGTIAANVTGTSFTNTGLTNGSAYYYVVSAVNAVGESINSGEAAGKPSVFLVNDNFETSTLGVTPAGYTPFNTQTSINNVTVINNNHLTNEYNDTTNTSATIVGNSTNVVWINDNATSGVRGGTIKTFAPVSGKKGVTAQLDFMEPKLIGDSYPLELLSSSGGIAVQFKVNSNKLQYGSSDFSPPYGAIAGTWYNLKFIADVGTNMADVYINGVYQGNFKFVSPVTDIAKIQARTGGSSIGSLYLDNIKVYQQEVTTPQNLTAGGANHRAELNWNAASGVDSYNIYRSDASGGTFNLIAGNVKSNNYIDTGLTNDINYYYKVTAMNAGAESEYSNEALALPNNVQPPAVPTGLSAVIRDSQITLNWSSVPGAAFYTLQRSTTPNGPFIPLLQNGQQKLTNTTYLDSNLTDGISYYYHVSAGNIGGTSDGSELLKAAPAAPLGTPTLISAEPGNNKVDLNWSSVTRATYYTVKRGTVNGGPYTILGNAGGTSYSDTTANNGTTYYYVVTAANTSLESMISNQLKARPYVPVSGAPGVPAGFKAIANDGSVSLSWNTVSGATSYKVKRAAASSGDGTYAELSTSTQSSFVDSAVTNGSTYYYVVSAVNSSGEGANSDEIIVLPAKVLTVDQNAAADGATIFNTIQSAVNKIPTNNTTRTMIYITGGTYTEKLAINSPYVSLVGAGIDVTTIVYGDYGGPNGQSGNVGSTFNSPTVSVNADNFTAANLTIKNNAAPRSTVGTAVALSVKSDQAAFESIKVVSFQDTLYNGLNAGNKGRHYFHNSIIQGDVDFIFGEAPAVVMDNVKTVLVSNASSAATAGGHITAAAQRSTADTGYVFLNSQVIEDSSALGTYDLGRAWKDYARVRFINTLVNSKNFLAAGWATSCAGSCITSYFSEYNSYGLGANPTARQISTQLTGPEASVTIPQLFAGWNPSIPVMMPKVNYLPTVSVTSSNFDKNPVNQADIYAMAQTNGYTLTDITNGGNALSLADYTVFGNVITINKSYLARLQAGTTSLSFNFGSVSVPLTVNIVDTDTSSDIGKQVLSVNDGWASFTTGTKGGSPADPGHIFTVTKRSELIKALGGNNSTNASNSSSKIIYIKGSIDMNVDDNDNPVGSDYYKDPNYDLDAYLTAYDPAVWGKETIPSGPLEAARAASETNQGNKIKINVGSNTTIVGLPNANAKITGGNLMIQNVDNVIIRNIEFENAFDYFPQWDPTDGDFGNWNSAFDNITVKGAAHIWVDHNTFSDGNNPDDYSKKYFGRQYQQHDGALDITNGSDLVTVSYNYFHDHDKTTLVGGSDSFTGDEGKEKITFHHNYYKNVSQRAPRVRYGQVHAYNNYYEGTATHSNYPLLYTIGVGYSSQIYADNNYFDADPDTQASNIVGQFTGGTAFTDKGSILNGKEVDIAKSLNLSPVGWTPTLYISIDPTTSVPTIVMAQAGTFGTDVLPPVWTNGSLTASNVTQTQATLTWSGATDDEDVTGYKIFSVADDSYTEVASLGKVSSYNVTGLFSYTRYTYTLKAADAAGNWSDYGPSVSFLTDKNSRNRNGSGSGPSGGSAPGTGNNPTNSNGQSGSTASTAAVKLDLNTDAKITKETNASGQTVSKVSVDAEKLEKALTASASTVVLIEVKTGDPVVKVELPASAILNALAEQVDAVVQIKVEGASYSIPISALNSAAKNAVVTVTIAKVSGADSDKVNAAAQKSGVRQLLSSPIDFKVEVNGIEMTDFNGVYVDRTVSINGEADPNKGTAVWVDGNNNMNFVPSTMSNNNGSAEVTIHSPHNSIYTVIQSDKTFADLRGHWSKQDVELLANKLIVNGVRDNAFAPDQQITRAEFAAVLVRSLGLVDVKQDNAFKDVQAADWFSGAVGAAQKAGLISGYEDGTFRPGANISREQIVTMIARALRTGGKEVKADTSMLDKFKDGSAIAEWAKDAAAQSLTAGIIQGTTDTMFAAQENATRAQSAAMLRRLLQYLQFIN